MFVEASLMTLALTNLCRISTISPSAFRTKMVQEASQTKNKVILSIHTEHSQCTRRTAPEIKEICQHHEEIFSLPYIASRKPRAYSQLAATGRSLCHFQAIYGPHTLTERATSHCCNHFCTQYYSQIDSLIFGLKTS